MDSLSEFQSENRNEAKAPRLTEVNGQNFIDIPIEIGRYRFTFKANEPLFLPQYAGSLFRGNFGWALKSLTCMTKAQTCNGCPVYKSCHFPALFKPEPTDEQAKRFPNIPAPYLFVLPIKFRRTVEVDETFSFELNLFGAYAIEQLPIIIMAWNKASDKGLGKDRTKIELLKVEHLSKENDYLIYEPKSIVKKHNPIVQLTPLNSPLNSITLDIITPTRIQLAGKILNPDEISAEIFLNALFRKVNLYSNIYLGLEFNQQKHDANMIFTSHLTRQNFYRYSNSQKQKMNLEGFIGSIKLTGELSKWWPLFQVGQHTHIGKNTSFGLGRYEITHVNNAVYNTLNNYE